MDIILLVIVDALECRLLSLKKTFFNNLIPLNDYYF